MSKCPNCGIEVESGAKFCMECGTKIPQTKECPSCHSQWPLTAKFCAECGYNFNAGGTKGGPVIGDKNVIAGDVKIDNSTTIQNTTVNNTIVQENEAAKVVKCAECEKQLQITNSFKCVQCGKYVCDEHFDDTHKMCLSCAGECIEEEENAFYEFLLDVRRTFDRVDNHGVMAGFPFEAFAAKMDALHISNAMLHDIISKNAGWDSDIIYGAETIVRVASGTEDVRAYRLLAGIYAKELPNKPRELSCLRKAAKMGDAEARKKLLDSGEVLELPSRSIVLSLGPKMALIGRESFASEADIWALTHDERQRFKNPLNLSESFKGPCVSGSTLTVKYESTSPSYKVVLKNRGSSIMATITRVCKANGMEFKDARNLVEGALPATVIDGTNKLNAEAVVRDLVAAGANAEIQQSSTELRDMEFKYALKEGYPGGGDKQDRNGIFYFSNGNSSEGPFKEHEDGRCYLYAACDAVGVAQWRVGIDGDFDPSLLDIYYTSFSSVGGIDYYFLSHMVYDGKVLIPANNWVCSSRIDEPVVLEGTKTLAATDGACPMREFDLDGRETRILQVKFTLVGDWLHYACEKFDETDRIMLARHRNLRNFEEGHVTDNVALVGSRLRATDIATGAILGEWTFDPRLPGEISYNKGKDEYSWVVDFEKNPDAEFLRALKRYKAKGACSECECEIYGEFDPSKISVEWCTQGSDDASDEWILEKVRYGDDIIAWPGNDHYGYYPDLPSAAWRDWRNDDEEGRFVPLEMRGDLVPQAEWRSWKVTKTGRVPFDLWENK